MFKDPSRNRGEYVNSWKTGATPGATLSGKEEEMTGWERREGGGGSCSGKISNLKRHQIYPSTVRFVRLPNSICDFNTIPGIHGNTLLSRECRSRGSIIDTRNSLISTNDFGSGIVTTAKAMHAAIAMFIIIRPYRRRGVLGVKRSTRSGPHSL